MPTVRIQEKNYSESIMVLKLKDGDGRTDMKSAFRNWFTLNPLFFCSGMQFPEKDCIT